MGKVTILGYNASLPAARCDREEVHQDIGRTACAGTKKI